MRHCDGRVFQFGFSYAVLLLACSAMAEPSYFDTAGVQSNHGEQDIQSFAEAINSHYGINPMLTARLTAGSNTSSSTITAMDLPPPPPPPTLQFKLPTFPKSLPPPPAAHDFIPVSPAQLDQWLSSALILDLRPRSSHLTARIPRALNLTVPSTLLKRPAFSLAKLSDMLSSETVRARFRDWMSANSILVYDADSATLDSSGSNIAGLLRKFRTEGSTVPIGYIQGGFTAVWKERRSLVDESPLLEDEDAPPTKSTPSLAPSLRAKALPMSAFNMSTTTTQFSGGQTPGLGTKSPGQQHFNPFYDTIRQNTELAHVHTFPTSI